MRVDPELGACCGDASVLLVAGEDLCGAVVFAPRRCPGPTYTRAARKMLVVPEIFVVLELIRVSPSACWTPTSLPSSGPAFLQDLTAGCWSWVEMRVRARVTAGCWSFVEIRVRVLLIESSY